MRPRKAYSQHKHNTTRRTPPIQFLLTFDEWWAIWEASGKYAERGVQPQQYCMARIGDQGPYAVGNVKIVTNAENRSEYVCSADARAKISRAKMGNKCGVGNTNHLGKKHSEASRAKMRAAAARRRALKGSVISDGD